MIRVAWPAFHSNDWVGGINYYSNLARACALIPDPRIEIILLGKSPELPPPLNKLPQLDPLFFQKNLPQWRANQLLKSNSPQGGFLGSFLQHFNISVVSHSDPLGINFPIPSLCWIPDFQHKHLPHFFSQDELESRDKSMGNIAKYAQAVLLSSKDAQKDFCHFYPEAAQKTYVLPFTASMPDESLLPKTAHVHSQYAITEPYFYIPNQLWIHKNHIIVFKALKILQSQYNKAPLIISTGNTLDFRSPHYFSSLQEKLKQAGLAKRFLFLGLVPFEHVAVLMRNCIALINPSRFEGWSTTVEEAKSLGKKIILSNLAVHKEQAPERGQFFHPNNAEELALLMHTTQENFDASEEQKKREEAVDLLPQRMLAYGLSYEDIILKVVKTHSQKNI